MKITRMLTPLLLTIALGANYLLLGALFIGHHDLPPADNWQALMGNGEGAILGWLFLVHSGEVLLGALIPGLLLGLFRPRYWLWIGMGASLPYLYQSIQGWLFTYRNGLENSFAQQLLLAGDMLVFLLALPLVAWLTGRLLPGPGYRLPQEA